ncbi:MAG: DM13 domain-containing protein [Ferruginibacter sp.]
MKKIFIFLLVVAAVSAGCKKEKTSTSDISMDPVDTTAQLKFRGIFSSGPYGNTSGVARIYTKNNAYTLVLDSFSVSSGPDLHVYISKEKQPVNFIDLGVLRTTNGTQVYTIQGMPDFMQYNFALIHCQQFNHLFGSASLQ